jgi:betaine reductase
VLEKEIEKEGIPCVLITALIPPAKTIGANRIVQGIAITNPVGDPNLSPEREKKLRREIVLGALEKLSEVV